MSSKRSWRTIIKENILGKKSNKNNDNVTDSEGYSGSKSESKNNANPNPKSTEYEKPPDVLNKQNPVKSNIDKFKALHSASKARTDSKEKHISFGEVTAADEFKSKSMLDKSNDTEEIKGILVKKESKKTRSRPINDPAFGISSDESRSNSDSTNSKNASSHREIHSHRKETKMEEERAVPPIHYPNSSSTTTNSRDNRLSLSLSDASSVSDPHSLISSETARKSDLAISGSDHIMSPATPHTKQDVSDHVEPTKTHKVENFQADRVKSQTLLTESVMTTGGIKAEVEFRDRNAERDKRNDEVDVAPPGVDRDGDGHGEGGNADGADSGHRRARNLCLEDSSDDEQQGRGGRGSVPSGGGSSMASKSYRSRNKYSSRRDASSSHARNGDDTDGQLCDILNDRKEDSSFLSDILHRYDVTSAQKELTLQVDESKEEREYYVDPTQVEYVVINAPSSMTLTSSMNHNSVREELDDGVRSEGAGAGDTIDNVIEDDKSVDLAYNDESDGDDVEDLSKYDSIELIEDAVAERLITPTRDVELLSTPLQAIDRAKLFHADQVSITSGVGDDKDSAARRPEGESEGGECDQHGNEGKGLGGEGHSDEVPYHVFKEDDLACSAVDEKCDVVEQNGPSVGTGSTWPENPLVDIDDSDGVDLCKLLNISDEEHTNTMNFKETHQQSLADKPRYAVEWGYGSTGSKSAPFVSYSKKAAVNEAVYFVENMQHMVMVAKERTLPILPSVVDTRVSMTVPYPSTRAQKEADVFSNDLMDEVDDALHSFQGPLTDPSEMVLHLAQQPTLNSIDLNVADVTVIEIIDVAIEDSNADIKSTLNGSGSDKSASAETSPERASRLVTALPVSSKSAFTSSQKTKSPSPVKQVSPVKSSERNKTRRKSTLRPSEEFKIKMQLHGSIYDTDSAAVDKPKEVRVAQPPRCRVFEEESMTEWRAEYDADVEKFFKLGALIAETEIVSTSTLQNSENTNYVNALTDIKAHIFDIVESENESTDCDDPIGLYFYLGSVYAGMSMKYPPKPNALPHQVYDKVKQKKINQLKKSFNM